jgi:hypothetical protein
MANLSSLKAGGVPSSFAGYTTISTSSSNQSVTGVGFKPNWIIITGVYVGSSNVVTMNGFKNAGSTRAHFRMVRNESSAPGFINSVQNSFYNIFDESLNNALGNIASFDADGFTISKSAYAVAADIYWLTGR